MRKNQSIAALIAALVLACAVVAWLGYLRAAKPAPTPVQAVAGASPASSASPTTTASPPAPTAAPSPTPGPVTYVPVEPTPTVVPTVQPTSQPTAAPTAPATATPAPLTTSVPSPTEGPVEQATIAPAHIAAPAVIRLPPDAPPRILAMTLSTPVASSGQTVSGTVETSSNVASVVARIGGYAMPMEKVGVGRFRLKYTVPRLPFFLHRTWMIQVIARNTRGDAVSTALPIRIR